MSIKYLIYKTTNQINQKFYIGAHQTTNINDGYLGSGNLIRKAINKYGKENFKFEVLHFCQSSEEMFRLENSIVNEELIRNPFSYNIKLGGLGGFNHITDNTGRSKGGKKSISNLHSKLKQRIDNDPIFAEYWANQSRDHLLKAREKALSPESRLKRSNTKKGMKTHSVGKIWVSNDILQQSKMIFPMNLEIGWTRGRKF